MNLGNRDREPRPGCRDQPLGQGGGAVYGVQFLSPWTVVTPQPYRYLERQHAAAFFADGSLQLVRPRFARHEDEQRKDEREGQTSFVERSERGENKTIASFLQMRCDASVLCASSYFSERLMRLFERGSWLSARINNTINFAHAVSRHVPGFIQGAERAGFAPLFSKNASHACQGESPPALAPPRKDGRLPACPSLRARRRSRSPARRDDGGGARASWSPGRSGASSPARLHPRLRQMSGVSVRPHVRVPARHRAAGP